MAGSRLPIADKGQRDCRRYSYYQKFVGFVINKIKPFSITKLFELVNAILYRNLMNIAMRSNVRKNDAKAKEKCGLTADNYTRKGKPFERVVRKVAALTMVICMAAVHSDGYNALGLYNYADKLKEVLS
jgi:hypothetical protein